jgi:hypothetical protein
MLATSDCIAYMSLYNEMLKRRVVKIEPIISITRLDAIIPSDETEIIFLEMPNLICLLPIIRNKNLPLS